jgi:recombination protein RecT
MTRAIANQEKVQQLRQYLMDARDRIAHSIPATAIKYLTPERVCRVVMIAATKSPQLLACTPASIANAAMQAASYGLEPGGALGEAALVPYGDQCQFQFQYRGLVTLAIRHGDVLQVDANVVREGDRFVWREGLEPRLDHEPLLSTREGTPDILAAYAIATLSHGKKFCVVPWQQIDKARALSKSPAWQQWPEEMCKKVAIKRLLKTVNLTPEVADAVDWDNADEGGETLPPLPDERKSTRTDMAKAKLGRVPPPKDSGEASVDAVREAMEQDRTAEGEPIPS